jgi:hypothetical protein
MKATIPFPKRRRNNATAIEMATLSWPAKRLVRRHGLRAETAKVIAEMIYTPGDRR